MSLMCCGCIPSIPAAEPGAKDFRAAKTCGIEQKQGTAEFASCFLLIDYRVKIRFTRCVPAPAWAVFDIFCITGDLSTLQTEQ